MVDIGRSPAFAFDAEGGRYGEFQLLDGAPEERHGKQAVLQWVALALRQQPDKIPIYRTQDHAKFGVDRDLLRRDLPAGMAYAEIERQISDTVTYCHAIRGVDNFRFARCGRGLQVSFTLRLVDGDAEEVTALV